MSSSRVDIKGEVRGSLRYLGENIVKLDGLINHQVPPRFMTAVGEEFVDRFAALDINRVTKVLTAEASGIAPAFAAAQILDVPMLYARKGRPVTMTGKIYSVEVHSRTKGGITTLFASGEYLTAQDRVVLVDDVLGRGEVMSGLGGLVRQSGAELLGMGCIVEKCFEHGRAALRPFRVPVISLVRLDLKNGAIEAR